jgi:hypothetical protein
MIISNCCQDSVVAVSGGEGTGYYTCYRCGAPCDIYCPLVPFGKENEHIDVPCGTPEIMEC